MNSRELSNATVLDSDKYEGIDKKFDVILLNPPQTAGKETCFDMIEGAKEHLKKGGTLQLVARHQKGGRALSEKMKEVFGNVGVLNRKGGYRVYCSKYGNS
jgi:16S rRNA G1207 methylase RsmC